MQTTPTLKASEPKAPHRQGRYRCVPQYQYRQLRYSRAVDRSLQKCLEFARDRSEIDIFTCQVQRPDGGRERNSYPIPRNLAWGVFQDALKDALIEKFCAATWEHSAPKPCGREWLTGCFLFLKRKVFETTRGFDPDFFLYYEETEWFSNRILKAGFQSGVCSEATVVHLGGGAQTPASCSEQALLSAFLYSYKVGPSVFLAICLAHLVNFFTRLACMPFVPSAWNSTSRETSAVYGPRSTT